jgi:hypothetical protein
MMDRTKIAEVLKAAADCIDSLVQEQAAKETQTKVDGAAKLANRIKDATGERIDDSIVSKLAETDPEIASLLERLAGSGAPDSLGGPEDDNAKTASDAQGMGGSDARFLNFILG